MGKVPETLPTFVMRDSNAALPSGVTYRIVGWLVNWLKAMAGTVKVSESVSCNAGLSVAVTSTVKGYGVPGGGSVSSVGEIYRPTWPTPPAGRVTPGWVQDPPVQSAPLRMSQPCGRPLTVIPKVCEVVEVLVMSTVKAAPGSYSWPLLVSPGSHPPPAPPCEGGVAGPHGTVMSGSGATAISMP